MKKFAGDIIVLHMCAKNHNHVMYRSWKNGVRQTIFCHYGPFFALLPPSTPRKLKFSKTKKVFQDIIILQMFDINESHMTYVFSDMECNRQFLLLFWTVFCPFTTLTTWKMKILKNWKKNPWRYHHFTQLSQKSWSYPILFLRYGT